MLGIKRRIDVRPRARGPHLSRYRRHGIRDVREHVEKVALLCVNYLLHFGQLLMAESFLSESLKQLLAGVWRAPECPQLGLIREELRRSGFEEVIAAGIVLTGGSAKMEGAIELAEEVFHVPVRLGVPQYIRGMSDVVRNPIYSTGAGLLLYARDNSLAGNRASSIAGARTTFERMKNWFQGRL